VGRPLSLGACALLVGVACSDDEKSASEIAAEDNAALLCNRLFACCAESELAALPFVADDSPPTREGCLALHRRTALEYVAVTESEETEGRIALHVDRSASCVADLGRESCADFHVRLRRLHVGDAYALCNPAIVEPLVEDGRPCRLYLGCRSGYCQGASNEDEGTCAPLPIDGEPCRVVDGCAGDLHCDADALRCKPLVPTGDPCVVDEECSSGACRDRRCASPGRCGG
jgi:hypothetical protein